MLRRFRSSGPVHAPRFHPSLLASSAAPTDPRAVRYFSIAARYNAAATEMGFLSLESAVSAGRLAEILRRAELAESAPRLPSSSGTESAHHVR